MKVYIRLAAAVLLFSISFEVLFPWIFPGPGILPDHPLYVLKVAQNKLIPHLIYYPTNRVEFDLLMADQLLYASKLLLVKGKFSLAKETALKGENYFSVLIADYRTVLEKKQKISEELNKEIIEGYKNQNKIITYLIDYAREEDKETYRQVEYFSQTNYQSLLNLQKPKKSILYE